VLNQDKDYFANLAVDAVLRLKGSTDLEHIQIIKKVGGKLTDSYLDEGELLELVTEGKQLIYRFHSRQDYCYKFAKTNRERQDSHCQHM